MTPDQNLRLAIAALIEATETLADDSFIRGFKAAKSKDREEHRRISRDHAEAVVRVDIAIQAVRKLMQ